MYKEAEINSQAELDECLVGFQRVLTRDNNTLSQFVRRSVRSKHSREEEKIKQNERKFCAFDQSFTVSSFKQCGIFFPLHSGVIFKAKEKQKIIFGNKMYL